MTIKTVGLFSPGQMGSAIGNVLRHNGLDVMTPLSGRSEATLMRAEQAGLRDSGSVEALIAESDIVISVLTPAEAESIVAKVTDAARDNGKKPFFVDCNALAPAVKIRMDERVREVGGVFVDAGIFGGPPKIDGSGPRIYCSGPDTSVFESLREYGLNIPPCVGPEIGQAAGLKMLHTTAGKGTRAVWIELLVAARAMGLSDVLAQEFEAGGILVKPQLIEAIAHEPRRSARMIDELEEVARTYEGLGLTPKMMEGAADLHRLISETPLAKQTSLDPDPPVDTILDVLAEWLRK